jgi:tetratricopeptide (TPR) repeat protein
LKRNRAVRFSSIVLTIYLLACGAHDLWSEQPEAADGGPEATLFLTTNPINADVLLDGKPLEEQTPLLLRELKAGLHDLEIRKPGFRTDRRQVTVESGKITTMSIDLASLYFSPLLPEETEIIIHGNEEAAADTLFQLPEGEYSFSREQGALRIEPVFPQDRWIRGLNLAVPLSLAFATVLTLHDIYYPKRAALHLTDDFSLSPATLTACGLTITLISFDVVLHLKRNRARESFTYSTMPRERSLHTADEYYERAEDLLALGQLEEALRFYTRVLEGYRDSPLYPYALFKTARIHYLTGEDSLAIVEFNLIADHYPLPDLYDKAHRGLADILLRRRAYRESIAQLQSMVFADPLYTKEEINLLEAEILEAWFGENPGVLDDVAVAYEALANRYGDSENVDLYRYKAAYYLHLQGRNQEAQAYLDLIDDSQVDDDLAPKLRDLRRSIRSAP